MNLTFNLRASFFTLFLVILMMAVVSGIFFSTLGSAIDVILKENYQSLLAGDLMQESLERQNDLLLARALGREELNTQWHALEQNFERAFHSARSNITIPGEELAITRIDEAWRHWCQLLVSFESLPDADQRLKLYEESLLPQFWELDRGILALVRMNQKAMVEADARARRMARNDSVIMGLLGLFGLAATVWFNRRVHAAFLEPLSRISLLTRRMQHGDFSLRLPQDRGDEFGILAREVNRLLERVELARQEADSLSISHRQVASALIEQHPEPALMLNNLGDVMLSNAAGRVLFTGLDGGECLKELRHVLDQDETRVAFQDQSYAVKTAPLITASNRRIGTLVTLEMIAG